MNECGLISRHSNRFEKIIDYSRIRRCSIERKVNEINAGCLGGCRLALDVRTLFGR